MKKSVWLSILSLIVGWGMGWEISNDYMSWHQFWGLWLVIAISWLLFWLYVKYKKWTTKQKLEVIEFILAYREFKEKRLQGIEEGSDEWRQRLKEFEETAKKQGKVWEYLLEKEIEEITSRK